MLFDFISNIDTTGKIKSTMSVANESGPEFLDLKSIMSHQLALKINYPKIVFILVFDSLFFFDCSAVEDFCFSVIFFFWKECRESSKIKHFFSKIIAFVNLIGKF